MSVFGLEIRPLGGKGNVEAAAATLSFAVLPGAALGAGAVAALLAPDRPAGISGDLDCDVTAVADADDQAVGT